MFPYFGEIAELSAALEEYRERMYAAYRKVLGVEFFGILEGADASLLGEPSFQSVEALRRVSTRETTQGTNKFFVASDVRGPHKTPQFTNEGRFKCSPFVSAPGFIFSAQAFADSRKRYARWIDPYLAPYIHEYDHFVFFALQAKPMIVALQVMADNFKVRVPIDIADIEGTALSHSPHRSNRVLAMQLLVWAYVLQEFYETSTRALDREIFYAMGLPVAQDYFTPSPKVFLPYPMRKLKALPVIPYGDVFFGKTIEHRLDMIHHWTERFRPSQEFQEHFMESFAKLEIRRCSFAELSANPPRTSSV